MSAQDFLLALQNEAKTLTETIVTENGDWIVKGFIDVYQRIYAMPEDTKVISKVLELFIIPRMVQFARKMNFTMRLASQQNFYPDISFISETTGEKYAIDIKSTYRTSHESVNGMTLGAFTGYFRDRNSTKNIVLPYNQYNAHIVLGVIYSRIEPDEAGSQKSISSTSATKSINTTEDQVYSISDLEHMTSVVRNFIFFAQPKYKIATAVPGSGNTRNIGSVTSIEQLVNGTGPFASLGEEVYDDYWMHYLNRDMARKLEMVVPYNNLTTYAKYKNQTVSIDIEQAQQLDQMDTGPGKDIDNVTN